MSNMRLGARAASASWPVAVDGCNREVVQRPQSQFHSCISVLPQSEEAPSPSVEVVSYTRPWSSDEVLSSSLEVTPSLLEQVFSLLLSGKGLLWAPAPCSTSSGMTAAVPEQQRFEF